MAGTRNSIDPRPAIQALARNGWRYVGPLSNVEHNGHSLISPANERRRVQFRGRNPNRDGNMHYWFGVYHLEFPHLDDMVFWVRQKPMMLVIPTTFLSEIFDPEIAKIDDHNRWHINIIFQPYAELVPVFDRPRRVDSFLVPVPDDVRRNC